MTDFLKEQTVKYLNKDFISLKRDLMKFSQAHHSGTFQDFNEASPGMALLELAAYVGDVLSFYQDRSFDELRRETQRQIENVAALAKQMGYRPSGKSAARGTEAFFIEVPATSNNQGGRLPDDTYSPIIRKGARVQGPNGTAFETLDDVYFSASSQDSPRQVTGSQFDSTTGLPTYFAIRKEIDIVAGETKSDTITVGDFESFKTVQLSNPDVIEVISVSDADGNDWFEVDYLAQDTVFDDVSNPNSDGDTVPYVLKLKTVPRRFITDRDVTTNITSLIFGAGDGVTADDSLIPNLADLSLPLPGRDTFSTFNLDPQNFLKTRSLGLSPANTVITVKYRVGGGLQTNVIPNTIKSVADAVIDFTSTGLDPIKKSAVQKSLQCLNPIRTEGGGPEETVEQIKSNSAAFFAAQNRVVTKEDYITRVLSMPARFGKPDKVYVRRNQVSPVGVDVHVLTRDANNNFAQATDTLVQNIITYLERFRMLTDGVNILQTDIVNLRLEFGIVVSSKFNRTEVLAKCLSVAADFMDSDKMQIGQPIVISKLQSKLDKVLGVISVYKITLKNVFGAQADGLTYSGTRFNVQSSTSNNILYCPENAIFEIKNPTKDISGETK